MKTKAALQGHYVIEQWRSNELIGIHEFHNNITDQGANALLNTGFGAVTQITPWYVGLIDTTGYTALANADTYQNINQAGNGWKEADGASSRVGYTVGATGVRATWGAGTAAARAITNASPMVYDITVAGTIVGVFCVGGIAAASVPGNYAASGVLWATASMTAIPVNIADQLKITYTVTS